MSNSPTSKEQNQLIDLSPTQLNPRDARPTDFEVGSPIQTATQPGHGQHGSTDQEYAQLLREGKAGKPIFPLPVPHKSIAPPPAFQR